MRSVVIHNSGIRVVLRYNSDTDEIESLFADPKYIIRGSRTVDSDEFDFEEREWCSLYTQVVPEWDPRDNIQDILECLERQYEHLFPRVGSEVIGAQTFTYRYALVKRTDGRIARVACVFGLVSYRKSAWSDMVSKDQLDELRGAIKPSPRSSKDRVAAS